MRHAREACKPQPWSLVCYWTCIAIGSHYFSGITCANKQVNNNRGQFTLFIVFHIVASCAWYRYLSEYKIKKFDGSADSIYAAHRLDGRAKHQSWSTQHQRHFFSLSSVGQHGPIYSETGCQLLKERFATQLRDIFIEGVARALTVFGAPTA